MVLIVDDFAFLQEALAEGLECKIAGFSGDFRFLSNFWPAPIEVEGITFPTVEHAYQAAKVLRRGERVRIAALPTPGAAKREGDKLEVRPGWDSMKQQVMERLVRLKFESHADLRAKLLATGACYLEEANTWGINTGASATTPAKITWDGF
jgi:ribA/ribD-fused uncharacterized protein